MRLTDTRPVETDMCGLHKVRIPKTVQSNGCKFRRDSANDHTFVSTLYITKIRSQSDRHFTVTVIDMGGVFLRHNTPHLLGKHSLVSCHDPSVIRKVSTVDDRETLKS